MIYIIVFLLLILVLANDNARELLFGVLGGTFRIAIIGVIACVALFVAYLGLQNNTVVELLKWIFTILVGLFLFIVVCSFIIRLFNSFLKLFKKETKQDHDVEKM